MCHIPIFVDCYERLGSRYIAKVHLGTPFFYRVGVLQDTPELKESILLCVLQRTCKTRGRTLKKKQEDPAQKSHYKEQWYACFRFCPGQIIFATKGSVLLILLEEHECMIMQLAVLRRESFTLQEMQVCVIWRYPERWMLQGKPVIYSSTIASDIVNVPPKSSTGNKSFMKFKILFLGFWTVL